MRGPGGDMVLLPLLLANAPSEWKDSAGYATGASRRSNMR